MRHGKKQKEWTNDMNEDRLFVKQTEKDRVERLRGGNGAGGKFVLYWMQQSQRAECNHALEYAACRANESDLPLLTVFGLDDSYPEANLRHYAFMLEGLAETGRQLERRGVKMVVRKTSPPEAALELARDASLLVCDRGYLRHQKAWRAKVARKADCPVVQVESDVVAPVRAVSGKVEYAARTIRPKIHKILDDCLKPVPEILLRRSSLDLALETLPMDHPSAVLNKLNIDRGVPAVGAFLKGGISKAKKRFKTFLGKSLECYDENGNQPQTDHISYMGPYLHFGQISPLYLALAVKECDASEDAKKAFLEQLIVRRELAVNYVENTPDYDRFAALPDWALKTLAEHKKDERADVYTRKQLENARTHDPYWNAAMREMKHTGFMHNYMRMYWGKKILEWCNTPEYAFRTALHLNNKYFLDGRDPNSYAGVAWLFGLHDRAFQERAVFGKVRYMAASGLERKFDTKAYIKKVETRIEEIRSVEDGG